MNDFQGRPLYVGDWVALYYGYNELKEGRIEKISNFRAKIMVFENGAFSVLSKWKYGDCMIKLHETQIPTH
ncbi:hypothetical protein [Citrobacter phage Ci1]|nr:hypothetical protein [Citrobacter phage Ci1]